MNPFIDGPINGTPSKTDVPRIQQRSRGAVRVKALRPQVRRAAARP